MQYIGLAARLLTKGTWYEAESDQDSDAYLNEQAKTHAVKWGDAFRRKSACNMIALQGIFCPYVANLANMSTNE